jgi:hypothetical protein
VDEDRYSTVKKGGGMSHQTDAKELAQKVEEFRAGLLSLIQTLPTNPAAKGNDKCFTIKFSQLDTNLNLLPETYNFKRQYQRIAAIINKVSIEKVGDTFKRIYENKSYYPAFHPAVIENVKTIWRPTDESNGTAQQG